MLASHGKGQQQHFVVVFRHPNSAPEFEILRISPKRFWKADCLNKKCGGALSRLASRRETGGVLLKKRQPCIRILHVED